jgi:hypothetical protein
MEYAAGQDWKKMHTEFWKVIAAVGARRFGEKKPIEFRI